MSTYQHNSQTYNLTFTPAGEGYRIELDGRVIDVESVQFLPDGLRIRLDGRWHTVFVSRSGQEWWLSYEGQTFVASQTARVGGGRGGAGAAASDGVLRAPMPGQVRTVQVDVGDTVAKGQTLMLLEAMKMEIRIRAPCAGEVEHVATAAGEVVQQEQTLITVRCEPTGARDE